MALPYSYNSNGTTWVTPMTDTVENLVLDLLEWVARQQRTYQETMDAWRTSCPKLPVWEDANDRGLVETAPANGHSLVRLTPAGLALLKQQRPRSYADPPAEFVNSSAAALPLSKAPS
jgi:hypothetical protein